MQVENHKKDHNNNKNKRSLDTAKSVTSSPSLMSVVAAARTNLPLSIVIEHGHGRPDHLPYGGGGEAGHEVEAIKAASLVSVELFHTEHVVQDRGFG